MEGCYQEMESRTGLLAVTGGAGPGPNAMRTPTGGARATSAGSLYAKQHLHVAPGDTVKGQPLPGPKSPRVLAEHPGPATA